MRIAIDAREAYRANPTGKGLFVRSLIEELQRRSTDLVLLVENGQNTSMEAIALPRGLRWHFAAAHLLRTRTDIDWYISSVSYIVPWLLGKTIPVAIVIHDLIAFDREPHNRKAKLIERLTLPRVLKTTRRIFTISQATSDDLLQRFPKTDQLKITLTYPGPTLRLASLAQGKPSNYPSSQPETINNKLKTIASIGTLCPRKNQLRLIQAFNALPENVRQSHRLILAGGRGWDDEETIALAKRSPNVEWRGYVSDEALTELLRSATLLAYPSLKEGFGLPVLDAMILGIPVLTSKRTSMEEIVGDAAMVVNPMSVEEIRDGLATLLTDEKLRNDCIRRGKERTKEYSWEKAVDSMIKAMRT